MTLNTEPLTRAEGELARGNARLARAKDELTRGNARLARAKSELTPGNTLLTRAPNRLAVVFERLSFMGDVLERLTTPSSATAERGALAAGEGGEGQDGRRWRDGRQQPA